MVPEKKENDFSSTFFSFFVFLCWNNRLLFFLEKKKGSATFSLDYTTAWNWVSEWKGKRIAGNLKKEICIWTRQCYVMAALGAKTIYSLKKHSVQFPWVQCQLIFFHRRNKSKYTCLRENGIFGEILFFGQPTIHLMGQHTLL